MGRPALAIGGIALIAAGAAIAIGWWPTDSSEDSQVAQPVRSVELALTSGDVRIRVGDVTATSVHETFHSHGSRSGHAYHLDDGRLVLDECAGSCTVDYEIVVPRGATVSGGTTSGRIELTGLANADVQTNSGDVDVHEGAGPVQAHSNSGTVDIELAAPQDVHAECDSGDITVRVPPDRYRVLTEAGSGDTDVQVAADPAAAHTLDLRASSGDIEVDPR